MSFLLVIRVPWWNWVLIPHRCVSCKRVTLLKVINCYLLLARSYFIFHDDFIVSYDADSLELEFMIFIVLTMILEGFRIVFFVHKIFISSSFATSIF